jgi:hypothetical protein
MPITWNAGNVTEQKISIFAAIWKWQNKTLGIRRRFTDVPVMHRKDKDASRFENAICLLKKLQTQRAAGNVAENLGQREHVVKRSAGKFEACPIANGKFNRKIQFVGLDTCLFELLFADIDCGDLVTSKLKGYCLSAPSTADVKNLASNLTVPLKNVAFPVE